MRKTSPWYSLSIDSDSIEYVLNPESLTEIEVRKGSDPTSLHSTTTKENPGLVVSRIVSRLQHQDCVR
jgi:hypothetical protein